MKTTVFLSLLCLLCSGAGAAEKVLARNITRGSLIEWKKLAGHVENRDLANRKLAVRDRNGNLTQVTIDEHVQIFKYWRLVALNDINLKDHVILKRSETGMQ